MASRAKTRSRSAPLVHRRCRRAGRRARRDSRSRIVLRGKHKPTLLAARRYRRLRRRGQRLQGPAHRARSSRTRSTPPHASIPAASGTRLPARRSASTRSGSCALRSSACCRRIDSGRRLATKLKIYPGADHPHAAQKPAAAAGAEDAIAWQNDAGVFVATGKRKSAVARVRLSAGDGKVVVNGRTLDEYFGRETSRMIVQPAVRGHDDGGAVRRRRERRWRRRCGAGDRDPARHHARAARWRTRSSGPRSRRPASSRATRARSSARSTGVTRPVSARSTRSADPRAAVARQQWDSPQCQVADSRRPCSVPPAMPASNWCAC